MAWFESLIEVLPSLSLRESQNLVHYVQYFRSAKILWNERRCENMKCILKCSYDSLSNFLLKIILGYLDFLVPKDKWFLRCDHGTVQRVRSDNTCRWQRLSSGRTVLGERQSASSYRKPSHDLLLFKTCGGCRIHRYMISGLRGSTLVTLPIVVKFSLVNQRFLIFLAVCECLYQFSWLAVKVELYVASNIVCCLQSVSVEMTGLTRPSPTSVLHRSPRHLPGRLEIINRGMCCEVGHCFVSAMPHTCCGLWPRNGRSYEICSPSDNSMLQSFSTHVTWHQSDSGPYHVSGTRRHRPQFWSSVIRPAAETRQQAHSPWVIPNCAVLTVPW